MKVETFESVWDALADTEQEAAVLKARSALLYEVRQAAASWSLPKEETARRLGVTRLQLDDLLRGRLTDFSLEALTDIAAAASSDIEVEAKGAA